jgi:hypothetical protein
MRDEDDADRQSAHYIMDMEKDVRMLGFQKLPLLVILSLMPLEAVSAMPMTVMPAASGNADIVKVQTMCDFRGCFTFGKTQSFTPSYVQPNYRPPTATGPTYYRPREAGPAPRYYNSQPPGSYKLPPVRTARPEQADKGVAGKGFHVDWCRNQYRSYNPKTDRFITYEGIYRTCNSPYD